MQCRGVQSSPQSGTKAATTLVFKPNLPTTKERLEKQQELQVKKDFKIATDDTEIVESQSTNCNPFRYYNKPQGMCHHSHHNPVSYAKFISTSTCGNATPIGTEQPCLFVNLVPINDSLLWTR